MTNIVFRTDAKPELGFGHLTRCRVLAHSFKERGNHCFMVGPRIDYQTSRDGDLFNEWHVVPDYINEKDDAEYFIAIAKRLDCTIAVLDDYRVRQEYQQVMLASGIQWLQFDWCADQPLWANWILNSSPAAKQECYASLLRSEGQKLLLGPSFAVLRPEFSRTAQRKELDEKSIRILVTFGGGNDHGAIIFVLESLFKKRPNATFVILSGYENKSNSEIINWIKLHNCSRIEIYINPTEVQPIMISCDFAIMSGGTSTFEAVTCGLPMIIITIADNQVKQALGWEDVGVGRYLGSIDSINVNTLQGSVDEFLKKTPFLKMKEKISNSMRIKGAKKITEMLFK